MQRIITYTISAEAAGSTVLAYLKQKHYSRSVITLLKQTPSGILVNQAWAYVSYILQEGDILTVRLIERPIKTEKPADTPKIQPVNLPISIVYEDMDILVVNKPAHMPTHPSMKHYDNTLANAAAYHAKKRGEYYPFRCINRLDRDTSGLTIIAKNPYSSCVLYEQMRNRQIRRIYYAVVEGMTDKEGIINVPIARRPDTIIERTVDFTAGEHAVTHYKTLAQKDGLSFLKLWLETGRTHQIRVHMSYIGHPLIGDFLYNPKEKTKNSQLQRQALHAGNLEFVHPITGQMLRFSTPLPEDILKFLHMIIS